MLEKGIEMKQIRIKISTNGTIEAETFGMKGKTCLSYLNKIEELANATTIDSEFTKEYYEAEEHIDSVEKQEVHG